MSASAGCRLVEVADDAAPTRGFPALVMYPADAPERTVALPPYTAEVAMDAPVAAGAHPLVVISHGASDGTPWAADIAEIEDACDETGTNATERERSGGDATAGTKAGRICCASEQVRKDAARRGGRRGDERSNSAC